MSCHNLVHKQLQYTNISRSKDNQTMKFGQLIEYNMKNIFPKKSYINCGGETIPRPFSKKSKLIRSLHQLSKVLYSLFLLYAKLKTSEMYWNYAADHSPLCNTKLLQKTKNEVWNWSLCLIFFLILKKNLSCYILSPDHISYSACLYFIRYCTYVHCNCLSRLRWSQISKLTLSFQ